MLFLAITSQTWIVTGIGFGIVLVLLFIFVFLMKGLGWIMQPHKAEKPKVAAPAPRKVLAKGEIDPQTQAAIAMALNLNLNDSDADMAAVAYALSLYYGTHDCVNPQLTVNIRPTAWNDRMMGMNNLHR